MQLITEPRLGQFYYGWMIVGVGLMSMAFWLGIRATFSVFYAALLEDFPWSRGETAGIQSMVLITYTIMAPIVGGLIDRFGPRRVIVPGIFLLALGLILCGYVNTLVQFYVFYGIIMATGATSVGVVSYTAVLAQWFERKKGVASGLAVSGMGLGTFLLAPLSQHFISLWGWRLAFVLLGSLALIILVPLNGFFLRHKPKELGLLPNGLRLGESPDKGPEVMGIQWTGIDWTLGMVLKTGRFWSLMVLAFLVVIGVYIILVHHVRFLLDSGIEKMEAAFVLASIGIISSGFRIFWGWLSDHIGREATYTMGGAAFPWEHAPFFYWT